MFLSRVVGSAWVGMAGLLVATWAPAGAGDAPVQVVAAAAKSQSKPWREVAIADIERAHALVREAHPGVLGGDEHFRAWFAEGHREALALAARASSAERAWAALQFYVAGYRDGHLAALREQPLSTQARWAGWTVQYRNGAYRVVKAAATWPVPTPSVGDAVLSCDGVETGALLARRVAPFVDRRMELDATRSHLAVYLTNQWAWGATWDPLRPRRCVVRAVSGRTREYALAWSTSSDGLSGLYPPAPAQGIARLASGTYWVHASDFKPSGQVGLDALVDRLSALGDAEAVVLDARGNGGGNSVFGYRLVHALLKERTPGSSSGAVAYWRVSPVARRTIEKHKALMEPLEGPAGHTTKFLARLLEDLDTAARDGEPFFKQMGSTVGGGESQGGATFRGKLVLVTDSRCASACLDFADLVRRVPNAVHAGASTSGDTRYMDIAMEPLPSGATLWVPMKVWHHRPRGDNQPLHPHFPFDGDITDTAAVQAWVEQAVLPKTHGVPPE